MKYLIFGKFSLNHIYFLFYPFIMMIQKLLEDNLKGNAIAKKFFYVYLAILSNLFSVIPFIIYRKLSKRKKVEKENKARNDIDYIYNNKALELSKRWIKPTFIIAIFEFISEIILCTFHFCNNDPTLSNYQLEIFFVINTVTQYFASYFILNYHFYKHHYLSFVINLVCSIIFLIIDIIELVKNKVSQYQFYIWAILRTIKFILLAIKDNYSKKVLFEGYISIFTLILFLGIFKILFLIIYTIPFIFLKTKDTNQVIFIGFVELLKGTKLLLSIGILICKFAYTTFSLLLIDKFSPSHLPLAFLMYSFVNNIYMVIKNLVNHKKNEYYLYLNFAFYIILFIATMIHNEIIIINVCGFNENTKMFLKIKLDEEVKDNLLPFDDENNNVENQNTLKENSIPLAETNPQN